MIRFTSRSLFKVISLCKSGRRYSDDKIAEMLFPNVEYTTNYIDYVKDCTKNLPDEITAFMQETKQEDIVRILNESVKNVFLTVVKTEKQTSLITAIQQLLIDDKSITDSTQIGYLPEYTKRLMVTAESVKPVEFIADALFCVCNQQNAKESIKEINDSYVDALKDKASRIILQTVEDTPNHEEFVPQALIAGDDFTIELNNCNGIYTVNAYEEFFHSWRIKNTGIIPWHNRRIVLENANEVRVKALEDYFAIPDLKPNESAAITVGIDARYLMGSTHLCGGLRLKKSSSAFQTRKMFSKSKLR